MKRRTIVIGIAWLLYTASWFFQVVKDGTTLSQGQLPGWEAFLTAFWATFGHSDPVSTRIIGLPSSLTNLLMVFSPGILFWRRFDRLRRALPWLLILAAILNAQWFILSGSEFADLRAGYYLWCASFFLLAVGCFLNQRGGRDAKAAGGNGAA